MKTVSKKKPVAKKSVPSRVAAEPTAPVAVVDVSTPEPEVVETVQVLRTCNPDMTSYGGFKWPESGPVEAPAEWWGKGPKPIDLVLGWDSPPAQRNVFGLIAAEPFLVPAATLQAAAQRVKISGARLEP